MCPETRARVKSSLLEFFSQKGYRRTPQREAIIEAAFGTTEHFSAEQLLDNSRAIDPSVSRATVYRTLTLLVESGALKELDLGGSHKVYDPNFVEHPHHNHLICLDCRKIIEFEDVNIELLENCITRRLGFSPASKHVTIQATCDRLEREGSCENRKPRRRPKTSKSARR
ncbi:MAG: transcriptional repressor [Terrimicrobiaceae bacterium]|nr:transcriptional repressor [Terrimicrobiaceae bacterium]